MTEKEIQEKLAQVTEEFNANAALTDHLLAAYMALPPMGELTADLLSNPEVGRKELFQIGFMQGVMTCTQARDPNAPFHHWFSPKE